MTNEQKKPQTSEWEERFDEGCNEMNISDPPSDTKWIKDFIRTEIAQARKEERERIWDLLFSSFPKDMENFELRLPDQSHRLLETFWEKLSNQEQRRLHNQEK